MVKSLYCTLSILCELLVIIHRLLLDDPMFGTPKLEGHTF